MKQLSGLDATFLHLETSAQFGHVSSLSIYTRPDVPDYRPYDAWRTQLQQRLHGEAGGLHQEAVAADAARHVADEQERQAAEHPGTGDAGLAREDVPALVAEVRRLRAEVEVLTDNTADALIEAYDRGQAEVVPNPFDEEKP